MVENDKKIKFWASTYFECVSDELRQAVFYDSLKKDPVFSKKIEDETNKEYKRLIDEVFGKTNTYEDILYHLKFITNSDMIIMFQKSNGERISLDIDYDDIVVLAETHNSERKRFCPILRSELIYFFNVRDPVLAIEDTIRIVNVGALQSDPVVGTYRRLPCTISYVVFNYGVDSDLSDNKYVYFAIFHRMLNEKQYISLPEVLPNVRNLLLYRPYLIQRIKKDFEKNVYGRDKETAWKNQWLSIEKAGAHADSDLIDGVINKSGYDNQCINKLFFGEKSQVSTIPHENNVIQLVSNVLIARYFRLLFSSTKSNHLIIDTVDLNNKLLSDIIQFDREKTIIDIDDNRKIPIEYDKNIFDEWELCHSISNYESNNRGLYCITKNTFRKKYLIAFLVDVFNNIAKRSSRVKVSIKEEPRSKSAYLVIQNTVVKEYLSNNNIYCNNWEGLDITKRREWCQALNYQLKQSIEFENAESSDIKKGISLGCLNAFIKAFPFGNMRAEYTVENDEIWYRLELPIIQNKQGEV